MENPAQLHDVKNTELPTAECSVSCYITSGSSTPVNHNQSAYMALEAFLVEIKQRNIYIYQNVWSMMSTQRDEIMQFYCVRHNPQRCSPLQPGGASDILKDEWGHHWFEVYQFAVLLKIWVGMTSKSWGTHSYGVVQLYDHAFWPFEVRTCVFD